MLANPQLQSQILHVLTTSPGIYPYGDKNRIARDVASLLTVTKTLVHKVARFMYDDGRNPLLFQLEGTIEIVFQGATYNTPVAIWLLEAYPSAAPRCFVTPTREMKIKDRHAHVGPQGLIYLPYLSEWHPARSQLIELVGILASTFSEDPPLYRAPDPAPFPIVRPPFQATPSPYHQPSFSQHNTPLFQPYQPAPVPYSSNTYTATPTPVPPPIPQISAEEKRKQEEAAKRQKELQEENAKRQREQQEETEKKQREEKQRRKALAEVTMNLQAQLKTYNQCMTRDIDEMLDTQRKLVAGTQVIHTITTTSCQQYTEMSTRLDQLNQRKAEVTQWLAQNDQSGALDIDEAVFVKDSWSKQLLELVAEDHAIEDCIDCFDRALADDRMPLPEFLKQVRKLARRQFEVRALCHKIFEAQQGELRR